MARSHLSGIVKEMSFARATDSGFSRNLIVMEVSKLNGIVRFIVRSVCRQF